MNLNLVSGLLVPFLGTALGAACVFFLRKQLNIKVEKTLTGFAAGVMVAASVRSLLIPSIEQSQSMGKWSFLPAVIGFWCGTLFLLLLDHIIPHLHRYSDKAEGKRSNLTKSVMLMLAVTIHNIPEGMAVGVVYAGWMADPENITLGAAWALALGIAIQNFPEGAIISMPVHLNGKSKLQSFFYGVLSGAVEPIAAVLTILAMDSVVTLLPYLLSFAAGAMIYVVVEELIPEMSSGEHSNIGTIAFAFGFTLMMALDVALG